ncbi:mas-related G-protein coupled receptor member X2-like [Ursus maritimus]|uniref:Mas-related G-protein coupled receptor member X2-like n=1 Tax=Ursus maritimus TaxID=29073 RepID=A0A384CTW8_URSMA|nr:mas-related G-protein coupled receptor member X2-like [Ursus maritimus]
MGLTCTAGVPRAHLSEEHSRTLLSSVLPSMDLYCTVINDSSNDAIGTSLRVETTSHVLFRSITVVVALCGLVGNGVVIWLVRLSIKKNSFCIYNLSLAVADFMHLGLQIVFCVRQILRSFLQYCFHLSSIFMILRFFSYFTGLGIMTAISFQRCLSVLFPIWYRCHCPKHLSAIVSVFLWLLTFLVTILRGHACPQLSLRTTGFCSATVTITNVWILLLLSVMGTSSLLLFLRVRESTQLHLPRKLWLGILLTDLVFFLCGMPLSIIRFLVWEVGNQTLNDICILLSSINSAVNPAIYFFIGRQQPRAPLAGVSREPCVRRQSRGAAPAPPNRDGGPLTGGKCPSGSGDLPAGVTPPGQQEGAPPSQALAE